MHGQLAKLAKFRWILSILPIILPILLLLLTLTLSHRQAARESARASPTSESINLTRTSSYLLGADSARRRVAISGRALPHRGRFEPCHGSDDPQPSQLTIYMSQGGCNFRRSPITIRKTAKSMTFSPTLYTQFGKFLKFSKHFYEHWTFNFIFGNFESVKNL